MTQPQRVTARRRRHFITGAGSGIGAAVAAILYDRGDELWLLARSEERAHNLWQRFSEAHILVGDLADPFRLELMLLGTFLPNLLDSLLHIAGVIDFDHVSELPASKISEQLNVNLVAPMVVTRALLPALRAGRGLVLIANSTATLSAGPGRSAYVASKAGLRGFTDVLRREESSQGVRVTTVLPGRTDTPMQQRVHEYENKAYDPERMMRADTVAQAILNVVDLPLDSTIQDLTITPVAPSSRTEPPNGLYLVNPEDPGTLGTAGVGLGDALEHDPGFAARLR